MTLPRWAAPAILLVAVLGGTLIRQWPGQPSGRIEFLSDGATVARLALEAARIGGLPAVDSLAEAPAGRRLGPALAPGLIVGAGFFHRLMAALGSRDAAADLMLFGSLAGGLFAIPVYLWARVQWGPGLAAPFAALLAVFLPAHLHRTFGYFVRYEALGSLLVASHLACLAAALAAGSDRSRRWLAAAAALLLAASLWAWRVPLIVPLLEAGLFALLLLARGAGRPAREAFAIQVAGGTLAALGLGYLRAEGVAASPAWLAAVALAAAGFVPRLAPGAARGLERAGWIAGAAAAGFLAGRLAGGGEGYGSTLSFLVVKLRALLGLAVAPDPMTRLMLVIEELGTMSPRSLFLGPIGFAFAGPWLLASPFVFWLAARRPRARAWIAGLPDHALFLGALTIALVTLTMFVHRAKVLAAAPAVVVVAGLLPVLLGFPAARPADGRTPEPAGGRPRAKAARVRAGGRAAGTPRAASGDPRLTGRIFAALLLACLGGNLWLSLTVAGTRDSRLPEGERAALEFLRRRTPADAIVAAPWELGFEIQSHAGRRTLMDGFLESPLGRERLLEFARLGFQRSAEPLGVWCLSLGATHLLVPPSSSLSGLATLADPALVPVLRAGARLNREQADRAIIRMMVFGGDEAPFREVFAHQNWKVYAVTDTMFADPRSVE